MDVRACIEQGQDGERKYCCAFFKVENNSFELTRIFKESFIDQR